MIAHKHITKIIAVVMAAAVCLCLCAVAFSDKITSAIGAAGISMEYEAKLFDTDSIIDINILMDTDDWNDMLENATAEEYYKCDAEINGTTFYSVAIRPKGNTSLTSIASDPTTDRYSFKLEFDHYVDGQTCFGLDKLVLNNNYADATNMKEALIYDMYHYLGADASLYNYAKISVNGEYWGVYLALEAVEDSFMLRNYGAQDGELYKPESTEIGGGRDSGGGFNGGDADFGGRASENMTPPDEQGSTDQADTSGSPPQKPDEQGSTDQADTSGSPPQKPDEQGSTDQANTAGSPPQIPDTNGEAPTEPPTDSGNGMGGSSVGEGGGSSSGKGGADLNYIDDDTDSYETIWDGEITSTTEADHKRVVTALKNISEGSDLDTYMDIDNLLRYMAVHVFSVNEDSLSGSMAHNYYLYESGGMLNLIPWDYNLSFGGMGSGNNADSVVNSAIDNAFSGTAFFDTLMEDEAYHSQYYAYLQQLVSEYVNGGGFDAFYERVRSQIDELVETDPTAFYSYDEYLTAVDTLYQVVKLRGESVQGQLDGTIPSTEAEQRSSSALVDASALDISVMGSMNNGGGESGFNAPGASANAADASGSAQGNSAAQTAPDAPDGSESAPPSAPDQSGGEATNVSDTSQSGTEATNASDTSQSGTEAASTSDSSQIGKSGQPSSGNTQQANKNAPNNGNDDFGGKPSGSFPGGSENTSAAASANNLVLYGISLLVLAAAMLLAALYRRKPRKR